MNTYATPESFKPGERWLVYLFDFGQTRTIEIYCLEWSPSKKFVKIEFAQRGTERWEHNPITLVERLPNESSDDKTTATAGAVEDDSPNCNCILCQVRSEGRAAQAAPEVEAEIVRTICRCERCEKFRNAPPEEIAPGNEPD